MVNIEHAEKEAPNKRGDNILTDISLLSAIGWTNQLSLCSCQISKCDYDPRDKHLYRTTINDHLPSGHQIGRKGHKTLCKSNIVMQLTGTLAHPLFHIRSPSRA